VARRRQKRIPPAQKKNKKIVSEEILAVNLTHMPVGA
jgi:hypothetical protein